MRARAWLLLAACCPGAWTQAGAGAQAGARDVRVQCVALRAALQLFLSIETNLQLDEHPHRCMSSSMVQMFVRESAAQLRVRQNGSTALSVALTDDDARFTKMLVLALIGRHYTAHFRDSQTHFVFNTATQTVTPRLPKCKFQKSFFILLLFTSIALLIFSMVVQNLKGLEHTPGPGRAASTAMPMSARMSIDFAPRRNACGSGYSAVPS